MSATISLESLRWCLLRRWCHGHCHLLLRLGFLRCGHGPADFLLARARLRLSVRRVTSRAWRSAVRAAALAPVDSQVIAMSMTISLISMIDAMALELSGGNWWFERSFPCRCHRNCGQRGLRTSFKRRLVGVCLVALFSMHFVDDLHVPCDFALNTLVGFVFHLALLVKFLSSLLHITHCPSDNFNLFVFGHPFVYECLCFIVCQAPFLGFLVCLSHLLLKPQVQRLLLLQHILSSVSNHALISIAAN